MFGGISHVFTMGLELQEIVRLSVGTHSTHTHTEHMWNCFICGGNLLNVMAQHSVSGRANMLLGLAFFPPDNQICHSPERFYVLLLRALMCSTWGQSVTKTWAVHMSLASLGSSSVTKDTWGNTRRRDPSVARSCGAALTGQRHLWLYKYVKSLACSRIPVELWACESLSHPQPPSLPPPSTRAPARALW